MGHMIISFEAEIDCAAGHAGYVATNVVTEQVMREEQISRVLAAAGLEKGKKCPFALASERRAA
jgi:hypothetical protein